MKSLISFLVGVTFALGLGISGMTQTHVVKGFLDIFGSWNLNLIGVMVGAIIIHAIAFHLLMKRNSPLLDSKFYLPTKKEIDKRLVFGAALFGLGWGWAGICPGPGIVSLASGEVHFIVFVVSMITGMLIYKFFEKKLLLKTLPVILVTLSVQASANNFREEAPKVAASLKKNLLENLQREVSENGAVKAVDFCHLNVGTLAKETSKNFKDQYEFGRVSHKTRNSNNVPKEWMNSYIDQFKIKKQSMKDTAALFHTLEDGKEVYLEPLWTAPLCLQCHGDAISKKVSDEITKRYPNDQARGFKVGDFRGFLWVKEKNK